MRIRAIILQWKRVLFIAGGAAVLYFIWTSTHFVVAYQEVKRAHIFPSAVVGVGWNEANNALSQELAPNAPSGSFTKANSAYLELTGATSSEEALPVQTPPPQEPEVIPAPPVQSEGGSPPEVSPTPTETSGLPSTPLEPVVEIPPPESETAPEPAIDTPPSDATQVQPSATEPATPELPPTNEPTSLLDRALRSLLIPQVFATTTSATTTVEDVGTPQGDGSSPAVSNDIPTCFVISTQCYTMEFSGFGVDGALTDKKFHGVELNFSFANFTSESELLDSKLQVRYYHDGQWRSAGEIYLNKELSNESNGGYFTATFDGLVSWNDLLDVKVVFEFVRGDERSPARLYLDSAWLDVNYSERIQDVLSGASENPPADAPENVAFELSAEGANGSVLTMDSGEKILFPYLDSLEEDSLMIRADRSAYEGVGTSSQAAVYASITNTGTSADSFRLFISAAGEVSVAEVARYARGVPEEQTTTETGDVTYFCESMWQSTSTNGAIDNSLYSCAQTGQEFGCAEVSDSGVNCLVRGVIIGTASSTSYRSTWVVQPLAASLPDISSVEDLLPPGHQVLAASDEPFEILPGQSAYFKILLDTNVTGSIPFVLSARGEQFTGDIDSLQLRTEEELRADLEAAQRSKKEGKVNTKLSARESFKSDELPEFRFQYNSQRNIFVRTFRRVLGIETSPKIDEVILVHKSGKKFLMPAEVTYGRGGEWQVRFKERPDPFVPGEYTLLVKVEEDGRVYEDTHTFVWGVLAINTVQSIYTVGDTAEIQMAALSPNGNTICDANLRLTITDPSGMERDITVTPSGLCDGNNVVDIPDYASVYRVASAGVYGIYLAHFDEGGELLADISDSFEVREDAALPLVVSRRGPTRINPTAPYLMEITVIARDPFSGTVREKIPADFVIENTNGRRDSSELVWDVSLQEGERTTLRYTFDALDKSPFLYTVGPLDFIAQNGEIFFQESRAWQISSDATGNMVLFWPNSSWIPPGWTCVSCNPGEDFYQRFVRGAATYGTTGGAATHTHTATGVIYASAAATTESGGTAAISDVGHSHTYTPTVSTESNLPSYRQLRVIRADNAGEPSSIPAGAIAIFDGSVPSGWTQYSAQDGYYVRGENTAGTTGGSNTHSHTITGTTGAASGGAHQSRGPVQATGAAVSHTHSVSTSTPTLDTQPPYIGVVLGSIDSTSTPPNNMISMWSDEAPNGWTVVSGVSGDLNGKFIKPSTSYGATGGNATSTHADMTSATTSVPSATATGRSGSSGASGSHIHNVDISDFTDSSQLPPFIEAIFAKRLAGIPVYTQQMFRWYVNVNAEPPTDPWPSGATNLSENQAISSTDALKYSNVVRLRMAIGVTNATSTAGGDAFKLQYAAGATCSASLTWSDVAAISSSTAIWRGYNNASVSDGATLSSTTLSVSNVFATYEEENNSSTVPNAINPAQYGEWDWVIQHNGASAGVEYCFRMVRSDGSALNSYSQYPKLITNEAPGGLQLHEPFPNEKSTTTVPIFEFDASDPEDEDVHYQIQVSTDSAFSSTVIDTDSVSNSTAFENILVPADKAPFNSGDRIRYVAGSALTNNTTYWWRIRSKDPSGSNAWSSWSSAQSITVDTSTTIDTWYQTTDAQFETDTLSGVQTSGSGGVVLISGSTTGTLYSSSILFEWAEIGNAWGELSWNDAETTGDIKYHVEYFTSTSSWAIIPEIDLPGNSAGFDTSPVNLLSLSPSTYSELRIRADFTNSGGSPTLSDWSLLWGTRVAQPTLYKLFDNEKTSTTTPTFEFLTTDPQSDDLVYQISWSTDATFSSGTTTRTSDSHAGFSNLTTPADTSPFTSGNRIRFLMQGADALTNGTTYWWRVRARDPSGGDAYSEWSVSRSFTVDTSINVSTWFQTTNEQFDTDSQFGVYSVANNLQVATSVADILVAYGEGTVQTPRYRIWDGSVWGSESSAISVGATINWVVTRAHPSAEQYALATMGTNGNVYVQIYQNGEWGDQQLLTSTVGSTNMRGFDIAYENTSGDLVAVYCDGDANPSYRVWNGTSWGSASGISVASAVNCGWIRLASDPTSDEIIMVTLPTDGSQYEAQVWSGSAWGNSTGAMGTMSETNEGMSVQYEESGGQGVVVVSNGVNNLSWNSWSGAAWSGVTNQNVGGFEWSNLRRNVGNDAMALCFIDDSTNVETLRWTGAAWTGQASLDTAANAKTDRAVDCVYETLTGRTNNIMAVYSDQTAARYQVWNGTSWSGENSITGIGRSATVQAARGGDHTVHAIFFDHINGQYDWSSWNGSSWATAQTLETEPSVTASPYKEPFMMAARNSATEGTLFSSSVVFSEGSGPKWSSASWSDSQTGGSSLTYHIQYFTSTSSWALIPDSALPGNNTGTTTGPFDLSNLDTSTYGTLRLFAELACNGSSCPTLNDWTLNWSEGITVSGTAKAYDQTTDLTSGTVAVAVNGSLQIGKTGTISNGTWSITNVTAFSGDVITVFIDGADDLNEAVAITKYDGTLDVSGMRLFERHLTLGSDDNPTITNANIGQFDNSVSGDEDIFHNVDAANDLTVCSAALCPTTTRILIRSGAIYQPDSASSGEVNAQHLQIDGTFVADNNTIRVSGSWKNNTAFIKGGSTVIFTATSTTETIDSSSATSTAFNIVTFGQTSGTATWNLLGALNASSTLSINYGTLAQNGANPLRLSGNLSIGSGGLYAKGSATTTFMGSGSNSWTDSSSPKQDMGLVVVDGSTKTVTLSSSVKTTNISIGADDTLDAGGANTIEVVGNWTNNNTFTAQTGTVNFSATSTGKTIVQGSSSFYNLTFSGTDGNWSFTGNTLTVSSNLTISAGTVTMPTGTTTIVGSFDASSGTFMHNNGAFLFTASSAKTINSGSSSFYDLAFNGSGSWSFSASATSTRSTIITSGSVTLPSGTLSVGESFLNNGGSFSHGNGTLRLTASSAQLLKLNGSNAYNVTFAGSGSWSFSGTNATSTNNVRFESGTATLPSGTLAVGGSFISAGGTFAANGGTVKFTSTASGNSVTPGSSNFYNLRFDGVGGGWTITESATSTHDTLFASANTITLASGSTLEVDGTFTNSLANASTTWTGTTLYLNGGASSTINVKSNGGDTYDRLLIGASTMIRTWNSSALVVETNATGALYSQDHAAADGSLYIYGAFSSTVNEYWSYATDFDGTSLSGGSERQVNVRIASSSSISYSTGTLRIVGGASATTTIANQGIGSFSFSVTGGSLNAQHYAIASTSAAGLSISGSTNVVTLSDGDYALSYEGGSSLTVASTVIDQNPLLQIQRVKFATTTSITIGYNVTETGTPSSYWWFRNHYGSYDGESYDNDPGGNPGYIRWDDSGFNITISGNVFSDHGNNAIGNPPCDGSQVVSVVVGTTTYTASCNAGSGAYSVPNVQFVGDVVVTAFLNTNGGKRAATVTKTPTADVDDMDLFENALIVRHEDTAALTIEDIASYDYSDDTDVPFTAATGSPDTLIVQPNIELYVWDGKTFTPSGNVSLLSGGSGDARDGRLWLSTSAIFDSTGEELHSIGGGLFADTSAVFDAASSTVTFTATTTGKIIQTTLPLTLWNAVFNGSGGVWSLDGTAGVATTTVQNALTFTAGSIIGTGDLVVQSGGVTGGGTFAMSGGTVRLQGTGNFGNSNNWQFRHLTFGNGSTASTTKTGSATTTVTGTLTISSSETLSAGYGGWVLSSGGTPFVISGTYRRMSAPFSYTATSSVSVANADYAALYLVPAAAGSPTFTLQGGTPTIGSLTIGDGTNPVTVTATTNDPSVEIEGSVSIRSGATYIASNIGALSVGGSWANSGIFTHSNASVVFDSSSSGNTITTGGSSFYDVEFDNVSGGWTVSDNATSTNHFDITNASSFTVAGGTTLAVGGTFTNAVGGAATTWTNSTLALTSGTAYSINTKTAGGDTYGTLTIGANTDIRSWNSSSTVLSVHSTGSLYSQDHAASDGSLYIWGQYERSSGSDYWSYATDFDGTSLGGGARGVAVRIASSSSVTLSGGVLDIVGGGSATTTVQSQGGGAYAFFVTGGTFTANYYQFRDVDSNGLNFSGSPSISSLTYGDLELSHVSGGTMMTVAGSVIDANPLKIIKNVKFATTTAVVSGSNVTATGSSGSSWKFNLHYGNFAGESFDSDPLGDPGYLRWDDSASLITISGNVYSDEGSTVSTLCDGSTQVVRLKVQGAQELTSSCNASTGLYSIPDIGYNPGDTLTVYLDTGGGRRAANVSVDPVSTIGDMHLYENRVIVRHEDTSPITIADMTLYDSDEDPDIPFDATDAATDTLILPPDTKLIVWNSKTFAPAGNVTVQSGGSGNSYDGSLEIRANGTFSAAGTQAHSIGGNFTLGSGATLSSANSTFTFTATTTGKTITPGTSSFYNIVFDGAGGNWAFAGGSATSTNDFTISGGTVTLPTGTTTIGGSFDNAGGAFMHNNGTVQLNATASGKNIRAGSSVFYNLTANGSGGGWTFLDTNATTTNAFIVTSGSVTAPSGVLAIGGSYTNAGTFTHNGGTVKFTAVTSGKLIQAGGSSFGALLFAGVDGGWSFLSHATTTSDFTIATGTVTLPSSTLYIGGSLTNTGVFVHNNGSVIFNATATGKNIAPGASNFNNVTFNSGSGGWTITESATSTNNLNLQSASSFTQSSGTSLAVGGSFTNLVGGGATTWSGSTLSLTSGTSYSINTKSAGGDIYGTLVVGPNTDVQMWNSSSTVAVVDSTGSLYSQDHAAVDGELYIWGSYARASGSEYWDYATDFDGTSLGGSSRQVKVYVASSSTLAFSGGVLEIVGTASATTTIQHQGSGAYALSLSGGTLNASYYQVRNTDTNGLNISGTPTISSLSNGDFELSASGGAMITLAGSALDANASEQITGVRFATSTGVSAGYNVLRTGSPVSSWTFLSHYGNYDGEAYDSDGGDECGNVRWSDSSCLLLSQSHFRWRNDDGAEGALSSEWYNGSWNYRKKVAITNSNASSLSNIPVKLSVTYDANMNSNFSDLRFTDSSGTTSIPYWVESTIASATSTLWVRVPSIPASGSATIYMYFGNAGATSSSNGDATFDFIDDFEDDNITEYSGDTSLFDTDTTFARIGTYGLDAGPNVDQKTTNGIYRTGSLTAQGKTIRYYQYVDAAQQDEPCTFFGVQGSGSNYAVCLDEAPSHKIQIAKDVESNDGSGTVLASTTVTYTTGWYEVSIDWLTSNEINVTVYDANGSVFATLNASDSSYTSGGVGFGFWEQHGGWDLYSVRPYAAVAPTSVFGVRQSSGGATWKAAEDTALTGQTTNENVRLRFSLQNSGASVSSQNFRLQFASKGASLNCESVPYVNYNDVPTATGGCGSSAACMYTSSQFTDQGGTSGLLSYPSTMNFAAGKIVEDPSNQASSMSLANNTATEIEYNFHMTDNATQNAYCFRSSNGGLDLDSYDRVAEVSMLHGPIITNISLNNAQDISLTEGATTTVYATGTVTDLNGYTDIVYATSTIYRSGVGAACADDQNNCYNVASTSCSFLNCSGNSCTLSCRADIQYLADPTDTGSVFAAQNWLSRISAQDSTGLRDTEDTLGVELLTLYGLTVNTASIDFGLLAAGQNTGTVNATTTIENSGNAPINIELSGTDLSGGSDTIPVGEQKFATTTFAYGSCSICQFLTGSATNVDVNIPKATATSTPSTSDVYWGINVPVGTAAESFSGVNLFTAVGTGG